MEETRVHDSWNKLREITEYVVNLTEEDIIRLYKELDIVEYVTPFGTIRHIRPKLLTKES